MRMSYVVALEVAGIIKNLMLVQVYLVEEVVRLHFLPGMDSIACLHIPLLQCISLTPCRHLCLQVPVEEMLGIE